jgi:tetraacyldisaccharide 4'-kinase
VRARLDEPSWWYGDAPNVLATCLEPAGALYGWITRARFDRTEAYRSRLPVVCVGNFTAGGTGKTPLTLYLCRHCQAAGHEAVVLTRGYGGRLAGPYWVDEKIDSARDVGDEALLLARVAPTLLAHDRRAGARAIENGPYRATLIIMDDGLQNPGVAKGLTFAVVDGGRGFGNGKVIPAGPLRAPLPFQLGLTDAIIVNEGISSAESPIAASLRHEFPGPILRCRTVAAGDPTWLKNAPVVGWAGIGAPSRFFSLLASLGARPLETVSFPDHHRMQDHDAASLLATAQRLGALLVTTEKDIARLSGATGRLADLAAASRALPIQLHFSDNDAERLSGLLDAALAAAR